MKGMQSYSSPVEKSSKDALRIMPHKKFGFHGRMPVSARNLCAGVGSLLCGCANVGGEGRGCNECKVANP